MRRRVTGSRGQLQLLKGAPLPRNQVLVALQELAVNLCLVPPHRLDPTQHLPQPAELMVWLFSFLVLFTSRGPHIGLQSNSPVAVTRGFPPKVPRIRHMRDSWQHPVFVFRMQSLCSAHLSVFCFFAFI
ncbi:hypothetical protein EYF80_068075 [Liparis tanakae]|uniref:Uncharacterized protein n=1 Tax=Liparis tanakae TaxID=230148 RepID=A0A4Z2E096_9TELE|nr:hypothetical protein EYF80_068075 [Liparis tanakae]